jgi:adenine phosphoribosyltransferase
VKIYRGQAHHFVKLCGLRRRLPIVEVDEDVWIASDVELILGDVEFIVRAAGMLVEKIKPFNPEVILTPEAKSIALAYEVSRLLGHKKFVVARKGVKAYMKDYVVEFVRSITTKEKQKLILTREDMKCLKGRRVCILDDVISTGGTLRVLEALARRAGGAIVCKAAVWKEGPWYGERDLIFLDVLPIFVGKDGLKRLNTVSQHVTEGEAK